MAPIISPITHWERLWNFHLCLQRTTLHCVLKMGPSEDTFLFSQNVKLQPLCAFCVRRGQKSEAAVETMIEGFIYHILIVAFLLHFIFTILWCSLGQSEWLAQDHPMFLMDDQEIKLGLPTPQPTLWSLHDTLRHLWLECSGQGLYYFYKMYLFKKENSIISTNCNRTTAKRNSSGDNQPLPSTTMESIQYYDTNLLEHCTKLHRWWFHLWNCCHHHSCDKVACLDQTWLDWRMNSFELSSGKLHHLGRSCIHVHCLRKRNQTDADEQGRQLRKCQTVCVAVFKVAKSFAWERAICNRFRQTYFSCFLNTNNVFSV